MYKYVITKIMLDEVLRRSRSKKAAWGLGTFCLAWVAPLSATVSICTETFFNFTWDPYVSADLSLQR